MGGGGDTEQICLIDTQNGWGLTKGWGFDKAGVQREDKGQEEKNNGDRKVEESEEGGDVMLQEGSGQSRVEWFDTAVVVVVVGFL